MFISIIKIFRLLIVLMIWMRNCMLIDMIFISSLFIVLDELSIKLLLVFISFIILTIRQIFIKKFTIYWNSDDE